MKLSRKFVSDYIELPNDDIKVIADKMTSVGNEYDMAGKLVNKKEKIKQKQILFLKNDLKGMSKEGNKLIIKELKQKLVELGAMKQIKNCCKTIEGHYIKRGK